jgi:hypothetical protein
LGERYIGVCTDGTLSVSSIRGFASPVKKENPDVTTALLTEKCWLNKLWEMK